MEWSGLIAELDAGATVVTARARHAHALRQAHGESQRAAGRQAWPTPMAIPYSAWLGTLYVEALLTLERAPQLLTESQRRAHWNAVLGSADPTPVLLQPDATARAAAEAFTLARRWRVDLTPDDTEHEDVRAFAQWASAYTERLKRNGQLDSADLSDWLIPHLPKLGLPPRLVVAGFMDEEPQRYAFLNALRGVGVTVVKSSAAGDDAAQRTPVPERSGTAGPVTVRVADPDAELSAAACWARARHTADSTRRVAVVVDDLEARRAQVMTAFDAVFAPQRAAAGAVDEPRPYGISLGIPLARSARVPDALAALALGRLHTEWPRLSQLLLCAGIAGTHAERGGRARAELWLRGHVGQKVALAWALDAVDDAPDWTARVRQARRILTTGPARRAPSAWGDAFLATLRALGFPGDAPSAADEDATGALVSLVARLGELDRAEGGSEQRIDFDAFSVLLQRQCNEELHQPRTPELPVQVLGTLEAVDLEFDHLWIAGWHDDCWPPAPRPNPFLPVRVQRVKGMPHATAALDRAHAARVTAALLVAAPEVVVSSPELDGDTPRRPSPLAPTRTVLLGELGPQPHPGWVGQLAASRRLETIADASAPALPAAQARGGTGVLKDHSDCPFKAFAARRLHAEALDTPPSGPDARSRGSLMHKALQGVWETLKDHDGLIGRDAAARETVVRAAVDAALATMRAQFPDLYPAPFVALERERLTRRILDWLDLEATRAPFTVRGHESEEHIAVGPLELHAFIDRVDQLEGGGIAVIDYKTGAASKTKWRVPRPAEPQLPIYALHLATQGAAVDAVLFARVKAGALGFDGITRDLGLLAPQPMKGVIEPRNGFAAELEEWRAELAQLAQSFAAGDAAVAPRKRSATCTHCHLGVLCRIGELAVDGSIDEEPDHGDD